MSGLVRKEDSRYSMLAARAYLGGAEGEGEVASGLERKARCTRYSYSRAYGQWESPGPTKY